MRTRWYVYIRWFLLLAIAVPGVLSLYVGEGWTTQVKRDLMLGLAAVASNSIFFALSRLPERKHYYHRLARVILFTDLLLITYLIFSKGGVESRSPILYAIPILLSAALLGRRAVYKTALASIALYDGLIIADYYGVIHTSGALNPALRQSYTYMINSVAFFSAVLIILGVATDYITSLLITKERQASESADALKRAQAIAHLGSWEWDLQRGTSTCSEELYRIFDIKPYKANLNYKAFLRRVHPEDRQYVEGQFAMARKNHSVFSFEHRIVTAYGGVRFMHSEGQVVADKRGRNQKIYGIAHDITDARTLERAKEEFVSLASHQLRTPATGVKVYLSMLQEGYAGELPDNQRELLAQAHSANERQIRIINDLLSIASMESGTFELDKTSTDLGAFIEEVALEHKQTLRSPEQSMIVSKPKRPVCADIDVARFRMILDNLISNASKYSRATGTIHIQLKKRRGRAYISVSDSGIGIAKKDIPKLFTKFSRLENKRNANIDGTGLGLYLVKYLVEMHGGTISLESRLGHGSTFIIELAVTDQKQSLSKKFLPKTRASIPAAKPHTQA